MKNNMQPMEYKELIEHIRLRPGMYLGRLGNGNASDDGIYRMFQEILNSSIDEFRQGYGDRIEVDVEDGHTVSIRDYGRGLPLHERTWESNAFLKTTGVTSDADVIFDVIKALSSHFEISSYKDGVANRLSYKNGMLVEELTEDAECEDGTSVIFTPDDGIFGAFRFVDDIVFAMLRNATYQNIGLRIVLDGTMMTSTDGMADLLAGKSFKRHALYPLIHFMDESTDVAFMHLPSSFEDYYSFVNGVETNMGGTHIQAFKEALASVFMELYPSEGFLPEDVCPGMAVAISINIANPMFESVNRGKLASVYITEDHTCTMKEYLHKFLSKRLKEYLLGHTAVCDAILGRITKSKEQRLFARKCLSMSIGQLVDLWNDGIKSGDLDGTGLYAIRDAFLAKKVQTIEMQRADAIGKRLQISYDEQNNIIHCAGRHFFETSPNLFQL